MDGSTADASGAILRGPDRDRPAPRGVPGLVRAVSTATPDAVALVDDAGTVSYAELEAASDAVARLLTEAGGRPGDVVAVCVPRGRALVFALLGALKAGLPYLPLAPEDPRERRLGILRRSGARLALVTGETADSLAGPAEGATRVLRLDGLPVAARDWAPPAPVADDHPAYVLFTSGSTGEPKGVVVPSLALCNRLLWMCETYGFGPADRVLQKTPATFDVSGWELLGPLVSGATEVLLPPGAHRDPGEVVDWVVRHAVTVCHFVPSMLEEFLRWPGARGCVSLRAVVCSGEALTPGLVRRFRAVLDAELHNLYGPTEAAIDVTAWECPPDPGTVLIGGPIDNCTLVVLDEDLRPVPAGEAGQLAIGGVPLALGYLNRPDLTEAAFVAAPDWCPVPRLYLTGDLVRRHGDALEYLGRMDHQVKIRGQRVELRETEDVLRALARVRDAAVVAAPGPDGAATVCAFVVPAPGTAADDALWQGLRDRVAAALPEAFVPALFTAVEAVPLTGSGKRDDKALRALAEERLAAPVRARQPVDDLAGCWAEAVGSVPEDEGVGFLDAGGHSLAAARLAGRILGRWGVRLPLSVFLRDNVSLAGLRARLPGTARVRAVPRGPGGDGPASPEQRRLWLWQQVFPGCPAYNVVGVLRVSGALDPDVLRAACADLIARHESLRTVLESSGGPRRRVLPRGTPELFTERTLAAVTDEAVRDFVARIADVPFPPDRLPRLAVGLLRDAAGAGSWLVLSVDHLVCDQRSLDLLQHDLAELYAARARGGAARLPDAVGFGDALASAPEDPRAAERRAADLEFWRSRLDGAPQRLGLPHARPRTGLPDHRGAEVLADLDAETSRRLDEVCRAERVTVATLGLGAYARALAAWAGRRSVLVGVPMSGRETEEQHEAVGFFMRTVPVRVDVPEGAGTRAVLGPVAEAVLGAAEHMAVTFDEIVAEVGAERSPQENPLFQAWFNDLTQAAPPASFGGHEAAAEEPSVRWSLFDLGLYLSRRPDGGYRLRLVHATDFWDAGTAGDFLQACREALLAVLAEPAGAAPGAAALAESAAGLAPAAGPRRTCADLVRAVLEQAERGPDRPALVGGDGTVTYAELAAWVRRVGALVRERTEPGRTVAVLARRTAGLAAALLGTWYAGRPALLVDAEAPAPWRREVLDAAEVALVLGTGPQAVPGVPYERVDRTAPGEPGTGQPDAGQAEFEPDAPGHLIVTSGTSGSPALVVLPADALPEPLTWYAAELGLGADDVCCLTTPPAHDPVLRALLLPLTVGARVHVPGPGEAERPDLHLELLARSGAPVLHLTPSQAGILAAVRAGRVLPSARAVVFHGEPLHDTRAEETARLAPGAALFNLYGTTETPQASSLHRWTRPDGPRTSVPVGRGTPYRRLEVVTASGRPALTGETGELVVTGRGLSTGYLNAPDRQASTALADGVRRYPTGDLARRDRHGAVTLAGRADRQVSLGGYRVELDAVEGAVARLRGVEGCAVATDPDHPGSLLAWVAGSALGSTDELAAELARTLPRWQQPAHWIRLPDLPLGRNGKADVPALLRRLKDHRGEGPTGTPGRPAPGDLARLITERARELCPPGAELMPDTVYFDAGMVSMNLLQLYHRLASADGLRLTLADVFRFPTPRALAAHLGADATAAPPVQAPRRETTPHSAADERDARRAVRTALRRGRQNRR
ncbi:amino acid adenylation domain-containing protein [Streptomyces sp. NPDC048106]|uniref:amino acid adenylation domain-containing protein n=1 Tax=Streptomyces sp. NPDC048106 TaxID=3155750 RepID=UPI003454F6B5